MTRVARKCLPYIRALYRDWQKRRGCWLSYSQAEPGRELTQPRKHLLAELCLFAVSFVASGLTTVVLVTKFVNQPAAHGSFAYSDTAAAALMSLGLLGREQWFELAFGVCLKQKL